MPAKRSIRMKTKQARATDGITPRLVKRSTHATWWNAVAGAVICVVVTAALIAAGHQTPNRTDAASAQPKADTPVALDPTPATASPSAAADTAPAGTLAQPPVADAQSAAVTITGCLERSDETFRLKDTAGVNVPKARSWRSGFLKKSAASIEVVDAPKRLNLPNHVGQRVSVTGTLTDRELHVRSLQRISASCSSTPKVKI